jgi:hypothetical protein
MPPKHPYIDEANKGAFLALLDNGDSIVHAAKKAKISIKSARRIKKHSSEVQIFCDDYNLSPPSLHDRVAIKPKLVRPYVMSEAFGNQLKDAIEQDRNHREMFQFEVAQELGIKASKTTIQREMKTRRLGRVKPTKKLSLADIQKAQRYELALSRKDWKLED